MPKLSDTSQVPEKNVETEIVQETGDEPQQVPRNNEFENNLES